MDPEEYVEAVLSLVETMPRGRVTTYGALADAVGSRGPRSVGRVMSTYGGSVPWWRVVRADGSLPPSHDEEAGPTTWTRARRSGPPARGHGPRRLVAGCA